MRFREPLLYASGGLVAFFVKLGVTVLFVQALLVPPITAYVVAVSFNVVFTYVFNHLVTFRVEGRVARRFSLYSLILGVAYALDVLLMAALTLGGLDYLLAVVLSTASLFVVKFLVLRRFVFR